MRAGRGLRREGASVNTETWMQYERAKAAFVRLWPDCPERIYEAFIRSLTAKLGL